MLIMVFAIRSIVQSEQLLRQKENHKDFFLYQIEDDKF